MTDRTTKALLLAIGLGLWAHVAGDWLRPAAVHAQAGASAAPAVRMPTCGLASPAAGKNQQTALVPKEWGTFTAMTGPTGTVVAFEDATDTIRLVDAKTCEVFVIGRS